MASRSDAASLSVTEVSVTSRVSRSGLRPDRSRAETADAATSPRRSWKTEQFTATWSSDGHRAACAQASDNTQAFSAVICPWASALGMRTSGGM